MSEPKQYVVMRPSRHNVGYWNHVRDVWWNGSYGDLWGVICRQDKTLWVFPVDEADSMFPNVGSARKERKKR